MKVEGVEYSIAKLKLMSFFLFSFFILHCHKQALTERFLLRRRHTVSHKLSIFKAIFSSLF